jgi:hypothetical protein
VFFGAHTVGHDDGNRPSHVPGGLCHRICVRHDDINPGCDKLSHDLRKALELPLGGPMLQHKVLALQVAQRAESVHEGPRERVDGISSDHFGDRGRGENQCDPIDPSRLLRARR